MIQRSHPLQLVFVTSREVERPDGLLSASHVQRSMGIPYLVREHLKVGRIFVPNVLCVRQNVSKAERYRK